MKPGALFRFLVDDHVRLADLLRRVLASPKKIDYEFYTEFRAGLLKHLAWGKKILLPAARQLRGGEPPPVAEKLRRDHCAIAALLGRKRIAPLSPIERCSPSRLSPTASTRRW